MRDTPIVWGNLLVIPKRTVPCTLPLLSERGLGGEAVGVGGEAVFSLSVSKTLTFPSIKSLK